MSENISKHIDEQKARLKPTRMWVYAACAIMLWTILVAGSFSTLARQKKNERLQTALARAEESLNKDIAYRLWVNMQGGVYAPVSETTPPNSNLSHVPERDIETPSGKKLTLVNPAYMTRQVFNLSHERFGTRAKITSLKPHHPENKPDAWEAEALARFASDPTEYYSVEIIEGKPHVRLIRPMAMEEKCMKCHREQDGYKLGKTMGAMSVAAPIVERTGSSRPFTASPASMHALLWLAGVLGILVSSRLLLRRIKERDFALNEMKLIAVELEHTVFERTRELSAANERLEEEAGAQAAVAASLRFSEARLRAITDAARDAIIMIDEHGSVSFWNPAAESIFGLKAEEALGKDLHRAIAPERYYEAFKVGFKKFACGGDGAAVGRTLELVGVRADGSEFPIELSLSALKINGGWGAVGILRDIASRKQTQAREREHHRFVETLLETIPAPVFSKDADGAYIKCNKAFEEYLGMSKKDILGKTVYDISPGENAKAYDDADRRLLKSGETQVYESQVVRGGGNVSDVVFHKAVFKTESGAPGGIIGVILDVTESKRGERAVRESEAKYRALIENVDIGVALLSMDMEVAAVNGKMKSWFPSAGSFDGRYCHEVFNCDVSEAVCADCPAMSAASDGMPHERVVKKTVDGLNTFFKVKALPVGDIAYGVSGIVMTAEDMTRQMRADEERSLLASIVENSADAIIGVGMDGTVKSWNTGAERIYGYSEDEAAGKQISFIATEKTFNDYDDILMKVAAGETVVFEETERRRKDGTVLDVTVAVSPIKDTFGEVVGVASVSRDISERKRIQKMHNEFVSTVSHELRTPLTSLRGSLGLLSGGIMGKLPVEADELVGIAARNAERLALLINDILDLQKIESGKIHMDIRVCNLAEIVERSVQEMSAMADANEIEISTARSDYKIMADPDRMVQVLDNLLSNAIKFSPEGTRVFIDAARENGNVIVSVRDQGDGISDSFKERIFNKFQQADSSVTRNKSGTGLGLAICKAIVEGHGGEICFESKIGEGSTFFFTVSAAKSETPEVKPPVSIDSKNAFRKRNSHRVLVVDDDAGVRNLLCRALENKGYEVDAAANVASAAGLTRDNYYNAVIVDIGLPDGSGFDVIRDIESREDARATSVIVVSGAGPDQYAVNVPKVYEWLTKPLDIRRLVSTVGNAVKRPRPPSVMLIDNDPQLTMMMKRILEARGVKVAAAPGGRQAVAMLDSMKPDLIVLDVLMNSGDGFYVAESLRANPELDSIPVVVYTALDLSENDKVALGGKSVQFFTKSKISEDEFSDRLAGMIADLLDNASVERTVSHSHAS
jgi:PAS domain S-box-containing protein